MHLTITLEGFRSAIWRTVEVPTTGSLDRLHEILQIAMGWTGSHLYEFVVDGQTYRAPDDEPEFEGEDFLDASTVTLRGLELRVGSRFTYEYDLGDGWIHDIVVDRVEKPVPYLYYPRCSGGAGAAPPENLGGPEGFGDALLELFDPKHPDHKQTSTWFGDNYDPMRFDQGDINLRLTASWARRMYFSVICHLPPDQVDWLEHADLENRGFRPPWIKLPPAG